MSSTPTGSGYWVVGADGGVFTFGDAGFYGSSAAMTLTRPIVGIAATPDAQGYWLVGSGGEVFPFGDARSYGSTDAIHLNQPIVGLIPTPSGAGYWLVGADGGVFNFGDAGFYGSTASMALSRPIVGMAPTRDGRGYWLASGDGQVFAFGGAPSYAPQNGVVPVDPVVAFAITPTGQGYWLVTAGGTVYGFGDAPPMPPLAAVEATQMIGITALDESGMCHAPDVPTDISAPPGASPGTGHWAPAATPVGGYPVVYTTVLSPRAGVPVAGLAWIDTNRTVVRLYGAPSQPGGNVLYNGYVDPFLRGSLLAAFNSGFKVAQSLGGWYAYGVTAIPLRDGAASLIIRSDGSATVGMWGRDATSTPQVVAVRQNLNLLVDDGMPVADLSPGSWGATLGSAANWRSGLGVDARGHLIYVGGPGLLPADLAQLLVAAGCVRAMELDINPQWVTFSTYTAQLGSTLLPTMNYGPGHFLAPSARDFIAAFAS